MARRVYTYDSGLGFDFLNMNALNRWPVVRQLAGPDRSGRSVAVQSRRSASLQPRVKQADQVVKSVCPYCAVGCGQDVYVQRGRVIQIEGDPDSPISRGRLCPKGSASLQLTTGNAREHRVLYRRPHATEWEELDLDVAMDMCRSDAPRRCDVTRARRARRAGSRRG